MNPLEAALDYASRGWGVFPIYENKLGICACGKPECRNQAKHPRNSDGLTGASTDPALIERWWRKWPNASIGIATGTLSGLWVLDIDPKDGGVERLAQLEAEHGPLPVTMEAITGSGGRHLFFQQRDDFRNSQGKNGGAFGVGIDTRGQGGYVVAAPSVHISGSQYRWAEERGPGTPIAPIPQWMAEAELARLKTEKREAMRQHPVARHQTQRLKDFKAAAAEYNRANSREWSKRGEMCPVCPGQSGFKAHPKIPGAWVCWHPSHPVTCGRPGKGQMWGNALDIDAYQRQRTPKQHLEAEGYWTSKAGVLEFYSARQPEEPPAPPHSADGEGPPPQLATVLKLRPEAMEPLSESFASLCRILTDPLLAKPVLKGELLEFCELGGHQTLGRRPIEEPQTLELRRRLELEHCDYKGDGLEFATSEVQSAITWAADKSRYHPIREYLEGLRWDGVDRLASMASDFFGAENSALNQAMMTKWMISAVARAMRPGCQVDTMLILVGKQGSYKSSFLRALCRDPEWYSCTPLDIHNKDAFLQIRDTWIYEWAELEPLNRARDVDALKSFITPQVDLYRAPYGRGNVRVPRSCVFAGTTNRSEFLSDPTGERRYWVVVVMHEIDIGAVIAVRDQLWAEAVSRFKAGEKWHLDRPEQESLEVAQATHKRLDPWLEAISGWIRGWVGKWKDRQINATESGSMLALAVTTGDILGGALDKRIGDWGKADEMRIGALMREMGYHKIRSLASGIEGYPPFWYPLDRFDAVVARDVWAEKALSPR